MAYTIRILGWADEPPKLDGIRRFVADYDPDRRHPGWDRLPGGGSVRVTSLRSEAARFITMARAVDYWKQPSTVLPERPDGAPNQPLTAFHVELDVVED